MKRAALATAAIALLLSTATARAEAPTIPPGQEALILEMLGGEAALPDGCTLAGASVEQTLIRAKYACTVGERTVELKARDDADGSSLRTARFSLVSTGDRPPPAALLPAIAERVRAREAGFRFQSSPPRVVDHRPAPDVPLRSRIRGALPALPPLLAFLVILVWLVVCAPSMIARRPLDAALFASAVALALASRLLVPWGPLDFAEAHRLAPVLGASPRIERSFATVLILFRGGQILGLPLATLLRFVGPAIGALGVGLTFVLARRGGLGRPAALLATAIVLSWPAHLRYSGTSLSLAGATAWTAALAALLSREIRPAWRIPLSAAAALLAVHARPELILLVPAAVPLVFADGWSRRERLILAGLLAVALGAQLVGLPGDGGAKVVWSPRVRIFLARVLFDPSRSPCWWCAAALAGLFAGRLARPLRAVLALSPAVLAGSYLVFANEDNPLFEEWRYFVTLVPLLAVAAASLVERVPPFPRRGAALGALIIGTLLSGAVYARLLARPVDLQVEFDYVRESAPRIIARHPDLLVVTGGEDGAADTGVNYESTQLLAVAASVGPLDTALRCGQRPAGDSPRVYALGAWLEGCTGAHDPALYLGIYRPASLLRLLGARFDLVPIEERTAVAAPAVQDLDTQCPIPAWPARASALPDCPLRLGWYRLVPRAATGPRLDPAPTPP